MDLAQIISFTIVASLLVMSPGPNGLLIAKSVPTSGKSAGFANIAGFIAAFYVHGSLSILGISILLVQSAQAFFVVKILGAMYLCWVGLKALLSAWHNHEEVIPEQSIEPSKSTLGKAFIEGFLTNVLNPKVSIFYLAAFPQFLPASGDVTSAFLLVLIHSIINLAWFSAMIFMLSRFINRASKPRFQKWLKATTGTIFIAFGIKLASLEA